MHTLNNKKFIDTFAFISHKIVFKTEHIERTFETFCFLNVEWTPETKQLNLNKIQVFYNNLEKKLMQEMNESSYKIRIVFDPNYFLSVQIEKSILEPFQEPILLSKMMTYENPTNESQFKFEDRSQWEKRLLNKPSSANDILVVNANNELIESSMFNIFLYDNKNDYFITPPLSSGCLNGVLRRFHLKPNKLLSIGHYINKQLKETSIYLNQVEDHNLFVGNSVRGFLKAQIIK